MISGLSRLAKRWRRPLTLKARLTAVTVGLFLVFIWALAFFSLTVLQDQFKQVLADQQFAAASRLAADLDNKLAERVEALTRAAAGLPAELRPEALDPYLSQLWSLHATFSAGIAVVGLDGRAIADYPLAPGRRGNFYGDRDYFRRVVEAKTPYIDKPIIGRALKRPVLTIGVPVFDGLGKLRAVMTGITDLTAANFLGVISDRALIGKGEFFVVSPKDHVIVAATDSRRALTAPPARGLNPVYDRFADGYEGSGIGASSQGVVKLYSAKRVAAASWIVVATLPTEVAFGPVKVLRDYLVIVAGSMTLAALVIVCWLSSRMLAPLEDAGRAMRRMTTGETPLAPLPVRREDEIGRLIGNFNLLVEDRRGFEAALAASEQRFRRLVEGAPDAIFVHVQDRFAYANAAALRLFGVQAEAQLLGQSLSGRTHADDRAAAAARLRSPDATGGELPPLAVKYLRPDGTAVAAEFSVVPFHYQEQDGMLVFARDVSERKRIEEERAAYQRQASELSRRLLAVQEEERRRLAVEIHDVVSPNLAAAKLNAAMLAGKLEGREAARLDDLCALLTDTEASLRDICANLRPPTLDYAGLLPALESYARQFTERTGVAVRITGSAAPTRLPPEVEALLFRIAQEALTNCAKHAAARSVAIDLGHDATRCVLEIRDDGVGFDLERVGEGQAGLGLLTMRERARFAGGQFSIASSPGQGTRISVEI